MNHFSNNLGSNDFNMLDSDIASLSLPTIDNSFEPTNPLGDNSNSNIDLSPPVQFTPQPLSNQPVVNTSVNISNTLNNDSVFSFDNNIDMYNSVNCNLNTFNNRNESGINRLQQPQQQNTFNYPLSLQQQQMQQMQQRQLFQQQQQQQQQQQFYNNCMNNNINPGWNCNSMVQQYPMMGMNNSMMSSNYNNLNMNPNLFDSNTFNTRNNITQGINNISLNSNNPSLLNNFMLRNNDGNNNNNLLPNNSHSINQNDNGSQITTSETSVDIDFDIKNEQSSIIDYSSSPIQQTQRTSMSTDTSEQNLSISNGVTNQSNIVSHTRSKRPLKRKQVPVDGRIDSRNKKLKLNNYQSRNHNKTKQSRRLTGTKDVKTIPDDKLNININDAQLSIFGIAISFIVVYNKKLPAIYLEEALKNIAKYCWNIHNTSLMECEISTEDEVPEPLKPKKPKKGRPPKEDKSNKKISCNSKDIVCVNKSFKYHSKKEAWNRLSCVINIQDLLQDNEFIKSCNLQGLSSNKELREKVKEDIINNIESDLKNKSNLTKLLKHVLQPFDIRIENKIVYQKMVCVREIDATKLEEVAEKEKKRRTDKTIRERKRRANKSDKSKTKSKRSRCKKKAVAIC